MRVQSANLVNKRALRKVLSSETLGKPIANDNMNKLIEDLNVSKEQLDNLPLTSELPEERSQELNLLFEQL